MAKRILCLFAVSLLSMNAVSAQEPASCKDTIFTKKIHVVPAYYSTQHAAFFCKKEVQLQKLTKVNVFLRLGSKDWVDYLERKPNAKK